ncbi:taste receptor type 2 member 4-like [Anolis carolinensis]|uniref:taste receptor type 2 member 4-like n=1 Tax=Anolis carolinensis TaxID=28377 RepID=UPI002F2B2BFF
MFSPGYIAFLVTAAVLNISGFISNGFIVTVMITAWTKSRRLASSEQLLLSLGLSNLWVTIVLIVFCFGFATLTNFNDQIFLFSFFSFAVVVRYWLTVLLCFFYCIKIVNSTHTFFLWCKLRISWLIPRLLVGSIIITLLAFVMILSFMYILPPPANVTTVIHAMSHSESIKSLIVFFLTVGSGCPFLLVLLCSILVVASLCGHVCQMTGKESHLRSFQTKAHVQAARTVLSLLLLFLSFFVAQTLSMTVDIGYNERLFIFTVMTIYSPAQAAILVLNNPKLKQALAVMVQRTVLICEEKN